MNNPEGSQRRDVCTIGNNLIYAYNLSGSLLDNFRVDRSYDSYDMSSRIDGNKLAVVNKVLMRRKFEELTESKVYGQVGELVVLEGVNSGWLGRNFEAWKSSDIDDVLSGVDIVVEAPAENNTGETKTAFNIGFDVTVSVENFKEKVDKTKIFLQRFGKFKELYYYTPQYKRKNDVIGIPTFPIFLPKDYIKDNYLDRLTDNEEGSIIKPTDFYQIFLLKQIIEQATRYRRIFENQKSRMDSLSVQELDRIINYFSHLLQGLQYNTKDGESLVEARDFFYEVLNKFYN